MKSKIQKKEELKNISEKLAKSKLTALTSFARAGEKGLNVAEMRQLKRDMRGVEADYIVAKKKSTKYSFLSFLNFFLQR